MIKDKRELEALLEQVAAGKTSVEEAALQLRDRIQRKDCRRWICGTIMAFTAFMVVGRLLSGVHWLTDIVGGALLSAGLVCLYSAIAYKNTAE